MKEKILKAIDKGLMNALSTDITDQDIDFNHDNIDNEYIPYEARTVDMGKAGIWCEYNIGAYPGLKPENWYGDYYAWGETEVKNDYSWKNYKYCECPKNKIAKYNKKDRLNKLESKDDIVTQTLGKKFWIPTRRDYINLLYNTTHEWVNDYNSIFGLNGMLFTAKNGNTLFFPAAGRFDTNGVEYNGDEGLVWASDINIYNDYEAMTLYFNDAGDAELNKASHERYIGCPVRGMYIPKK